MHITLSSFYTTAPRNIPSWDLLIQILPPWTHSPSRSSVTSHHLKGHIHCHGLYVPSWPAFYLPFPLFSAIPTSTSEKWSQIQIHQFIATYNCNLLFTQAFTHKASTKSTINFQTFNAIFCSYTLRFPELPLNPVPNEMHSIHPAAYIWISLTKAQINLGCTILVTCLYPLSVVECKYHPLQWSQSWP